MGVSEQVLVFDGHNDVLTRLAKMGGVAQAHRFIEGMDGHLDVAKARAGGFGGGFFAVWLASPGDFAEIEKQMEAPAYFIEMPEPLEWPDAMCAALAQVSILNEMERLGAVSVCTSTAEIRRVISHGGIAAVFHLEGAEPLDRDLNALDVLYRAGLRSLGPVWSRNTIFANGVPFAYPASPDIGPGLTEDGKRLIARCNALGIMIDLSHMNEAGFWDVADVSDAPLVATHSNAHSLCLHARNLTDDQLRAIAQSDGMVGLNFAVQFLRADGRNDADTPVHDMLRHLDHLISILGESRVGLGSDFDGATLPSAIGDASGLSVLRNAMSDHGYDAPLIEKLCFENWMRVLDLTWRDDAPNRSD